MTVQAMRIVLLIANGSLPIEATILKNPLSQSVVLLIANSEAELHSE